MITNKQQYETSLAAAIDLLEIAKFNDEEGDVIRTNNIKLILASQKMIGDIVEYLGAKDG